MGEIVNKLKKSISTSTSTSISEKKDEKPPKGAKIRSKDVRTESEEIENGWLLTKRYDISWELGDRSGYSYYTLKWYSEENPIKVTVETTDKTLADAFDEDNDGK